MKHEKVVQAFPDEVDDIPPAQSIPHGQDVLIAAKGSSISFLGRVFEYIVRFAFSIVVARSIGAEQFGLYTLGFTVISILSMVALSGLQTGMVRFLPPAIRQKDDATVWGTIQIGAGIPTALGIVLAAGLFLFARPLAIQIFHDPRLVLVFRLICLAIPLDALGFIAFTIIVSFKKMQFSTLAQHVVTPVAKLLLTVGFLMVGFGMYGVIIAYVVASVLGLVLLIYFINLQFPLKRPLRAAKRNTGQLLRYSLSTHLGWIFLTVRGTLETLILGFLGLTLGVGVFAAAARLTSVGNMLFSAIGGISAPIISDLHTRRETSQLKAYYQTTTRWLLIFNLPLFLTFVIFATPLLSVFGAEFIVGANALKILAVGTLVYTCTGVGATVLDMTDHPKLNSTNTVMMVFFTLSLDILLIPRWGVNGAALASASSTVFINVLCLFEVLVLLHMHPYDRSFLKPLVAGIASAIVTLLLYQWLAVSSLLQLIIGGIVLWGVYIGTLLLLKFSKDDLLVINNFRSRLNIKNILRHSISSIMPL
jgi:O-antigen/teichoic acid export membrane protein